jgi:phosphoglycerate dehydrogenase-like enzyme
MPGETLMLSGKTVGVVGFGFIGKNVARFLKGFGCNILYNKRAPLTAGEEADIGARYAALPELLAQSDVVSLNCPLTPETAGIINRTSLQTMKRTAVLVNVARGGVVIEDDLVWALRNRVIHAAAMDVFETEPLSPDSSLIGVDNLIITPHLAAIVADNFETTVRRMFDNIARVSRGEPVPELDSVV